MSNRIHFYIPHNSCAPSLVTVDLMIVCLKINENVINLCKSECVKLLKVKKPQTKN